MSAVAEHADVRFSPLPHVPQALHSSCVWLAAVWKCSSGHGLHCVSDPPPSADPGTHAACTNAPAPHLEQVPICLVSDTVVHLFASVTKLPLPGDSHGLHVFDECESSSW